MLTARKSSSNRNELDASYTDNTALLNKMSRLAREELRHFEQVLKLMTKRGIAYESVTASRYAQGLREKVRKKDPHKLVDTLIVAHSLKPAHASDLRRFRPMWTPN